MKIIRHKTPTEECFLVWMNNHPESFHALDEQLFYQFAQCIFSYGATKWLNKSYFKHRILEINPKFLLENIDEFYNRLLTIKNFNDNWKLNTITTCEYGEGFIQRQVVNNRIEEVVITEIEYNCGGLTTKEFKKRLDDHLYEK